jgi:hypothetical protein
LGQHQRQKTATRRFAVLFINADVVRVFVYGSVEKLQTAKWELNKSRYSWEIT